MGELQARGLAGAVVDAGARDLHRDAAAPGGERGARPAPRPGPAAGARAPPPRPGPPGPPHGLEPPRAAPRAPRDLKPARRLPRLLRALLLLRRAAGGRAGHGRVRHGPGGGDRGRERPGAAVPSREEPGRRPRAHRALPRLGEEGIMIAGPAIDIRGGRVVRLKGGVLQDETVYGHDPVAAARAWEAEGALRLHLVDLDAAIEGKPQPEALGAVIDAVKIPVEVGGGLRVLENAMRYKQRGADRLIFGTAAVARPGVVQPAVNQWPEAVVVALDARNGRVTVAGWQEVTTTTALELAARVKDWGVLRVQYTDVVRDGTLTGPNLEATAELARASRLRITAGGGVASLDDLRRLSVLAPLGIDEGIVGKALYEKRFTLREAMEAVGSDA